MKKTLKPVKKKIKNILLSFYTYFWSHLFSLSANIINTAKMTVLVRSLKSCGSHLLVQFPVMITHPDCVELGDNVSFAAYVHIWGGGCVSIGNRVMVGANSSISSLTHDYNQKYMYRTLVKKAVYIGDDAWIGSNCSILPGVTIGHGAVVGAGSVVLHDIPPDTIVAGVPARVIKQWKYDE